ncbi:MAG: hypothetical protein U9N81_03370 [Bacillota bacterium]|nr:hypothetical protein [Bacillota bacterium]
MFKKLAVILVLLLPLGFFLFPDRTQKEWSAAGGNNMLSIVGSLLSSHARFNIVYNPGLRDIGVQQEKLRIRTILPHTGRSYQTEMDDFLQSDDNVLIECSGMDTWHTSASGSSYLTVLRKQAYRVVVFDGGHHLSTLGMAPDIVIVPTYKGYAVHGYMRDGIQVKTLVQLLQVSESPIILVTVPRWRLVKQETCLTTFCAAILIGLKVNKPHKEWVFQTRPRISRWNNNIYAYVNKQLIQDRDLLLRYCNELKVNKTDRMYVAFDYRFIKQKDTLAYIEWFQQEIGVPVRCVNDPVKVADLILR